ncbi:ABC transporter permease [Actinokineospora auranticolor]|uniref:ABC-2 family transporter n=1 Tax=Actinokineospora auranticolor TaxID=155976 RepID=A0A2S6GNK3_9PSEU|nr:ABC transporter permease [Actinokineospora auranticolor]PPK66815.1 hypothetical protein CLV40_109200 [Actinokineospora auranticolor]
MLWLTFRQHRAQVAATAALLVAIGTALLVNAATATVDDAGFGVLAPLMTWLPILPVAVGVFWGAPLVAAEHERGTALLAWTQSVSRDRWVAVKLALLGTAVTAGGLLFGVMVQAWLDHYAGIPEANRFAHGYFVLTGVVPGLWWLFAFLLGAALGAVLRRTVAAMAVTVGALLVVMLALTRLRGYYVDPVLVPMDGPFDGQVFAGADRWLFVKPVLGPSAAVPGMLVQPADRYWRFQWTEAAILGTASLALAGAAVAAVRRRA